MTPEERLNIQQVAIEELAECTKEICRLLELSMILSQPHEQRRIAAVYQKATQAKNRVNE